MTVAIYSHHSSLRSWSLEHANGRPILSLEPALAYYGTPARFVLAQGDQVLAWEFFGGIRLHAAPMKLLTAAASLRERAGDGLLVCLGSVGDDMLSVEIVRSLLDLLKPDEIVVDSRLFKLGGLWSIGSEGIFEPEQDLRVQKGVRKAQWVKLLSNSLLHKVPISSVRLIGRIGAGRRYSPAQVRELGLSESSIVEVAGSTALVVTSQSVDERLVSRIMDDTGASRAKLLNATDYSGLICCCRDSSSKGTAIGSIQNLNLESGQIELLAPLPQGSPIAEIELGRLTVNPKGAECTELGLWDR